MVLGLAHRPPVVDQLLVPAASVLSFVDRFFRFPRRPAKYEVTAVWLIGFGTSTFWGYKPSYPFFSAIYRGEQLHL